MDLKRNLDKRKRLNKVVAIKNMREFTHGKTTIKNEIIFIYLFFVIQ